ncbi:NERD domain-containing protein [Jeotgalibacillus sp. R-1-5s-1]|uniref:NERD domain-containing protein n=1 Tax=Jeotgalibacillus sp. R-1-5s-1 TaxID=2555897 RepID=UPI00106A156E|nr:NERD domain-containing protein [Jeotgalibacillus sp. R-1-5s-1]TFD98177.1 NERD domain-containing protein [Jeotgalibacillus sp. R-1-5s-1]
MAQLIKLQDYVSRYERDMIRYPSQYVRLKKQQWNKLKEQWEDGGIFLNEDEFNQFKEEVEGKSTLFDRFKKIWVKNESQEEVEGEDAPQDDDSFRFEPSVYYRPETIEDLKHLYLDQLFHFQLKWASSTLTEKSYIDAKYTRDEKLKYFLQRFPDTFLLMYEPVMLLKKAPVELEILLFTPTDLWCISILEEANDAVFVGSMDRFWKVKHGDKEHSLLSPILSLDRTESIIKTIFAKAEVDFSVKKAIMSRNGYLDFPDVPYGYRLLDKRTVNQWHESQKNMGSPFKHMQMKAAKALIDYTQTTSVRRMQWSESEQDENELLMDPEE